MPSLTRQSSYCPRCVKNVPHHRWIQNRWWQRLDRMAGPLFRWLNLGPWYCIFCDRKTFRLAGPDPDAIDYQSPDRPDHSRQRERGESEESEVLAMRFDNIESVGNFLKSDQSLVSRSHRLLRFSAKYRDSVVRRMLAQHTSIHDVCRDQDVSQAELMDWVADLVRRLDDQVAALDRPAFDRSQVLDANLLQGTTFESDG